MLQVAKSKLRCFAHLSQAAFSSASKLTESAAVYTQGVQKGPGQKCWSPWSSYQLGKAGTHSGG